MAVVNETKRSVPPMPDPRDTDQSRINRQVIDILRFIMSRIDQANSEQRLSSLEDTVSQHDDIING